MTRPLESFEPYVPLLARERFLPHAGVPTAPRAQTLPACVFFADISGFTPLVDGLSLDPAGGAEAAQEVLGRCFGPLTDEIGRWGGEVLRFPGDAVLALWRPDGHDLAPAVGRAAHCALRVQQVLDRVELVKGRRVRLRIAIGAGTVWAARVGGVAGRWELLVRGEPIDQLAGALAVAFPGEAVLSPQAAAFAGELVDGESRAGGLALRSVGPMEPAARPDTPGPALESSLRAFVPHTVQARIDAGQRDWLAEFRTATVVFAGISGIPAGGTQNLERLQRAVRAIQSAVYRYGGSVNELLEDDKGIAVVLAWGVALHAHEDDPVRAVRAALEIHETLAAQGVDCRLGIATARMLAGRRGSPERLEFGLIGTGVNQAARMMQQARPVLCDAATHGAASGRVLFESLPPIELKGVQEPLPVHRPLGLRPDRGDERDASRLVGRDDERALAETCVRELVEREEGGALLFEGDAGIGKSRMVAYLCDCAKSAGASLWVGGADAIEQSSPYHAWKPIVAGLLGRPDPSEPGDAAALRRRILEHLPEELRSRAALLSGLLPVSFEETEATERLQPQARAEVTREVLVSLLLREAVQGPLVVVLEDAHWMDSASWELAEAARRRVPALLLVIAARPLAAAFGETARRLRNDPGTRVAELDVLSGDDSLALVCQRLGVHSVPAPVAELVHDRAEGHPLFTEELVLALLERGALRVEGGECRIEGDASSLSRLELPETIQGIVTSRIDHLTPQQQLTLKVASVLGRRFDAGDLAAVHPVDEDPDDVASQLGAMARAGLLQRAGETGFAFKHAIVQETTYRLLPSVQRCELHRRVAERLESVRHGDTSDIAASLAYHWREARVASKARHYLEQAGDQALNRDYANREAAYFFDQLIALELEDPVGDAGEPVQLDGGRSVPSGRLSRARWERQLGEALHNLGRHEEAVPHTERSLALLGHGVPRSRGALAVALLRMLVPRLWRGPTPPRVVAGSDATRSVLRQVLLGYERLGAAGYTRGDSLSAMHAMTRAVELAERLGAGSELAKVYADFSNVMNLLLRASRADAYSDAAVEIADVAGDPVARAWALSRGSLHRITRARWEVKPQLEEALVLFDSVGNGYQWEEVGAMLANLELMQGDLAGSLERYRAVHQRALDSGSLVHELWAQAGTADAMLRMGRLDEAAAAAEAALARREAVGSGDVNTPFQCAGILAMVWKRKGDVGRSGYWAARAREALTADAALGFAAAAGFVGLLEVELEDPDADLRRVARTLRILRVTSVTRTALRPVELRLRGGLERRRGRTTRARRRLRSAMERAEALGLRYETGRARCDLAEALDRGDAERAVLLKRAAGEFDELGADWDAAHARAAADAVAP